MAESFRGSGPCEVVVRDGQGPVLYKMDQVIFVLIHLGRMLELLRRDFHVILLHYFMSAAVTGVKGANPSLMCVIDACFSNRQLSELSGF